LLSPNKTRYLREDAENVSFILGFDTFPVKEKVNNWKSTTLEKLTYPVPDWPAISLTPIILLPTAHPLQIIRKLRYLTVAISLHSMLHICKEGFCSECADPDPGFRL